MAHWHRHSAACGYHRIFYLLPFFIIWTIRRLHSGNYIRRSWIQLDVVCIFAMGAQEVSQPPPYTAETSTAAPGKCASMDERAPMAGIVELPPDFFPRLRPALWTWLDPGTYVDSYPG